MAQCRHLLCYAFIFTITSSTEIYLGDIVSDGLPLDKVLDKDDPHCTHHIHKFYRQMKCQPETSPNAKCPTSYKCPTLQERSMELCYYAGEQYPVGFNLTQDVADFHTPCIESCQCVRMYEGARFYCSQRPREPCQSPSGCRHFSFMEDFTCCQRGVTSCNQGKQDSVKCMYEGRSYTEGEKFFPTDDVTCTQCVCASGFNGTLAAPYCHEFSCALELWGDTPVMLTRGCIPVYLSDTGCCPVFFRCPKPTDKIIKPENKTALSSITDKTCRFGNLTMKVGDQLSPMAETNTKEVVCTCKVPPLASCVRRNFVLTEEIRREFAREGLDNHP